MSNLSELLPSGGGAKSATFVASGTLPNGKAVVLKDNGQVELVAETTTTDGIGTETLITSGTVNTKWCSVAYDSDNSKIVVAFRDGANSSHGTALVGTISGNSISFGTAVVFNAGTTAQTDITYDTGNNKFLICYQDESNSNQGAAIVGSVSGTSISFGTEAVFDSGSESSRMRACYDVASGTTVITYADRNNSYYGTAIVATISGTSVTFGTQTVYASYNGSMAAIVYDASASKVLIASSSSGAAGAAIVGTVSGTTISFGTAITYSTSNDSYYFSAAYDANAQKTLIVYDANISGVRRGACVVATVSGTSVTVGTEVLYSNFNTSNSNAGVSYDSDAKKITIFFKETSTPQYNALVGTISGTSVTFGTPVALTLNGDLSTETGFVAAYDPTAGKTALIYATKTATTGLYYGVWTTGYTATNLTATNFVGITDQAIASGASGSVVVQGGVGAGQTSLTIGSTYYVQEDGTISTVSTSPAVNIGKALSATTILLKG